MMVPFVLMLLAIAVMPLIHLEWWNAHFRKGVIFLAGIIIFYYLFVLHDPHRLSVLLHEYFSFIILMGSLFVVTGGVHLRVQGEATPLSNTLFLVIGAVLANFIGTTGASMLLIRPWIHSNRYRITAFHLIFFIFMISNVGGCLSPIGDPPLFLGYLRGIPFFWLLEHLWRAWLVAILLLTGVFYFLDRKNFLKAPRRVREFETAEETWVFKGLFNLGFIALIIGAVFLSSPWRELLMILAVISSYLVTPQEILKANKFSFHPIEEIAWLFFGIFVTLLPVLDCLEEKTVALSSYSNLQPLHFYYFTGLLSGFLDNAPTYLTFLQLHLGLQGRSIEVVSDVIFSAIHDAKTITAISLGAVFFGGMTYIGNGPNFMIKSIAEEEDIRMPHFFSYIFCYSLPILLPVLILVGWLYCC